MGAVRQSRERGHGIFSALFATLASFSDFAWVLGTGGLLGFYGELFTETGSLVLVEIAVVVAAFGVVQLLGVRQLSRRRVPAASVIGGASEVEPPVPSQRVPST